MASSALTTAIRVIAGVGAAYLLVRGLLYFKCIGRQSISSYWSRLCFRFSFAIHFVNLAWLPSYPSSDVDIFFDYMDEVFVMVSILFLILSVQDFFELFSRRSTIIKRIWPYLFIVMVIISFSLNIYALVSQLGYGKNIYSYIYCIFIVVHPVLMILLVCIPFMVFLIQIQKSMARVGNRFTFAQIFFIFVFICIVGINIYQWICIANRSLEEARKTTSAEMITQMILLVFYIFIQDIIDWIVSWLLYDDSNSTDFDSILRDKTLLSMKD